jgi:hypothetical protein
MLCRSLFILILFSRFALASAEGFNQNSFSEQQGSVLVTKKSILIELDVSGFVGKVKVRGAPENFYLNPWADQNGFSIEQAQVISKRLNVMPFPASGVIHQPGFLDSKVYERIIVSNIECQRLRPEVDSGKCTGFLNIKGIIRRVTGAVYARTRGQTQIRFQFLLSDFRIEKDYFLWEISDIASVNVQFFAPI